MGLRTEVYDCQVAIIYHELSNVTDSRIFAGYYFAMRRSKLFSGVI